MTMDTATDNGAVANTRIATLEDASSILAIYSPFCHERCSVSFELEPPSLEEMQDRITKILPMLPWLVWQEGTEIAGYAYASPHRQRAAYRWSVDTSIYLSERYRQRGIGRHLYEALLAVLRRQGFYNAYAGITLPNDGSIALHTCVGFRELTVYKNVGYKADRWHDVAWYHLTLQPHADHPADPVSLAELGQVPMLLSGSLVNVSDR